MSIFSRRPRTERVLGPYVPELRALLLDASLRWRMKRHASASVTDDGLRRQAARFREANRGAKTPPFVKVERLRFAGCDAEWVQADDAAPKKAVLYLHGGGFFMSSPEEHRPLIWRMARATRRRVLAIDYRKAPDHAFPAWLDDAFAAYEALLADGYAPADIVVSGDSAGGNIALALTHRIRARGLSLPGSLVLFSPWADLLCEGRTYDTNRRRDAMFDGNAVRALGRYLTRDRNGCDPELSPIHADFRGFPRMLLFAGSTEVFLDDARTVARRAALAGVPTELYVHRHLPHVFPIFAGIVPRAKGAFDIVRRFVEEDPSAEARSGTLL
jgi:monoterpene epsilon-lactone hydrolase